MAEKIVKITGQNLLTSAVKSAANDLNTLKDSANRITKTFAAAFEIGTAVAIIKKSTKLIKSYLADCTDPSIQQSMKTIKDNWSSIKSDITSIANQKLAPLFDKIASKSTEIRNKFADISNVIMGSLSNIPEAISIISISLSKTIAELLDWKNVSKFFENIAKGIIGIVPNLVQAIVAYINAAIADLTESFRNSELGLWISKQTAKQARIVGTYEYKLARQGRIQLEAGADGVEYVKPMAVSKAYETAASAISNLFNQSYFSGLFDLATDGVTPILDDMFNQLKGLNTVTTLIEDNTDPKNNSSLTATIKSTFDNAFGKTGSLYRTFATNIQELGVASGIAASLLKFLVDELNTTLDPIFEMFRQIFLPIVSAISNVLQMLLPVITPIVKIIVAITGTIEYAIQYLTHIVASAVNKLSELKFFGKSLITTSMADPGAPGSYKDFIQNKWSAIDTSFGTGTSAATSISSATYQGATSVTINIYQQAPVVGDGGMRTFAQMIRSEFEALDYYGVTV